MEKIVTFRHVQCKLLNTEANYVALKPNDMTLLTETGCMINYQY